MKYESLYHVVRTGIAGNITGYGDFTHNTTAFEIGNQKTMGDAQYIPNISHSRGLRASMAGRGRAGGLAPVFTVDPV